MVKTKIIIFVSLVFSLVLFNPFILESDKAIAERWVVLGTFPQDTSSDGLKILEGEVKGPAQPKVGDTLQVRFILKNVSGHTIKFDSNGVFVGARWNSTTDANNRDFGHKFRGQTRHSGANAEVKAQITVDRPGTWRFWPAYHINGHYGPFRWHEVVVNVQ